MQVICGLNNTNQPRIVSVRSSREEDTKSYIAPYTGNAAGDFPERLAEAADRKAFRRLRRAGQRQPLCNCN
jgi:hypothetical protein